MTERRPSNARGRSPLSGAFPLTAMALATFLVVFALLMARVAGSGPALNASVTQRRAHEAGAITVGTRTSGAAAAAPAGAPTSALGRAEPALVTRASGSGARDD